MGRLIHTNDLHNAVMMNKQDWGIFGVTIDNLIEGVVSQVPTVEAIPKADYENRLKADMVAMLEDLRLAIEELDYPKDCDHACNGCLYWGDVDKLIDEKINALKGENETC